MIKNENYILIQGFMVNELELKGNELLIYAIIYGFSQAENQRFNGSLQYLADWTNTTKRNVMNNLKSLIDKKLIIKHEKIINGVKFCEYSVKNFSGVVKKFQGGIEKFSLGGGEKISPNNIDIYNIEDNIDNNSEDKSSHSEAKEIIDYLNLKANKHFKYTNNNINKIKARYKDGFTKEDFIIVIDKKCNEWLDNADMNCYLRPDTLFGSKFESYLNQKEVVKKESQIDKLNKMIEESMREENEEK